MHGRVNNFLSQFLDFNGEHLAVYPDTCDLEVYSQYVGIVSSSWSADVKF
jgi:hypothetical protein